MKALLQQSFFRSEYSQRKVSASELTKAVEELAIHVANFSINEQDYSVLLRYFSFGIEKVSGMFKWLWKNAFKDAFGAADVTKLDGLL